MALLKELHLRRNELGALTDLLELNLDDVKDRLVTCDPQEFSKLQGEAVAYDRLLKAIIRGPMQAPMQAPTKANREDYTR